MIRVKAIRTGFYGGQLRIPDTPSEDFEIESRKELGTWMLEVKKESKDESKEESKDDAEGLV